MNTCMKTILTSNDRSPWSSSNESGAGSISAVNPRWTNLETEGKWEMFFRWFIGIAALISLPCFGETIVVNGCPNGYHAGGPSGNSCVQDYNAGMMGFFSAPEGKTVPVPPAGGGNNPPPTRPTKAQCEAENKDCVSKAAEGVKQCEANAAQFGRLQAARGEDCHGTGKQLLESLSVTLDYPLPGHKSEPVTGVIEGTLFPLGTEIFGRGYNVYCSMPDITGATPISYLCRHMFTTRVIAGCMADRDGVTNGKTTTVTTTYSAGQGTTGQSGEQNSISVAKPPKTGFRTACVETGREKVQQCGDEKMKCDEKASGTIAKVQATVIYDVIARIDRDRLGIHSGVAHVSGTQGMLSGSFFRSLSKGEAEMDQQFALRMNFLAAWSKFLASRSVDSLSQTKVQEKLQQVQREFFETENVYISLLAGLYAPDPATGQYGSTKSRSLYDSFVVSGNLKARVLRAEATLLASVATILGAERAALFKAEVWPGVWTFGHARPMTKGRDTSLSAVNTGTYGTGSPKPPLAVAK